MTWDGKEERRSDSYLHAISELIRQSRDEQRAYFDARINELGELIRSGFPDDNPGAHRAIHEAWIKEAEAKAKFYQETKGRIFVAGIVSALGAVGSGIVWVVGLVIDALKMHK